MTQDSGIAFGGGDGIDRGDPDVFCGIGAKYRRRKLAEEYLDTFIRSLTLQANAIGCSGEQSSSALGGNSCESLADTDGAQLFKRGVFVESADNNNEIANVVKEMKRGDSVVERMCLKLIQLKKESDSASNQTYARSDSIQFSFNPVERDSEENQKYKSDFPEMDSLAQSNERSLNDYEGLNNDDYEALELRK